MVAISLLFYIHNAGNFLDNTFNNLFNQSFKDFEVICVDDGSTDNSLSIIKKYSKEDKRIKFISLNQNSFSKSINLVLDLCVGKYVYFLNPDTKLKFYALGYMFEQIEEKNADFILTDINFEYNNFYYNKSNSMNLIYENFKNDTFNYLDLDDLIFGIDHSLENKLFNLDFLRENHIIFSEELNYPDILFYYEALLYAKKVFYLKDFLFENRKPLNSLKFKNFSFEEVLNYYNSILELFKKLDLYEDYENNFLDLKISIILKFYNYLKEELKEDYFNCLRKNIMDEFINGKISEESVNNLFDFNRKLFEQLLISESFYEFDLLRKNTIKNIEYSKKIDKKSFLKLVRNQSFDY